MELSKIKDSKLRNKKIAQFINYLSVEDLLIFIGKVAADALNRKVAL